MTVATDLATIVKTAYTASEQTAAVTTAESLLSGLTTQTITSNVDDSWDTAIIELALKILPTSLKMEADTVDPLNISFQALITKSMREAVREVIHDESTSFIFRNATARTGR